MLLNTKPEGADATITRPDRRRALWRGAQAAAACALLLVAGRTAAEPPAFVPARAHAAAPAIVERVRYTAEGKSMRVVVMLSRAVPYEVRILPGESTRGSERRLVLDLSNARLGDGATQPIGVEDGLLKQIRTGQFTARTARVVLDLASVTSHSVSVEQNPTRIVVDIAGRPAPTQSEAATDARPPAAPSDAAEPRATTDAGADPTSRSSRQSPAASSREPHETPVFARHAERPSPRREEAERDQGRPHAAPVAATTSQHAERDESAPLDDGVALAREAASLVREATPPTHEAPVGREATVVTREAAPLAREAAPLTRATPSASDAPVVAALPPAPETGLGVAPPARGTPWRIVLDPGHGGSDPGTQGVDGVFEKDVTLAIAKRLKRRLEDGLHAQVLLTRESDVSRSLAQRTAFANVNSADIFVSIHANADASGELRGIETYTLNNTDERATMRLAKMENGPGVHTGRGDLSFILSDMVQSGKEEDSIALAQHLHSSMLARLRARYPDVRNLGVKKGPFYVLVGAYMPCVLVETSFLSHPTEGRRLASPAYQDDIAEGLYRGMADFLGNMRLAKTL